MSLHISSSSGLASPRHAQQLLRSTIVAACLAAASPLGAQQQGSAPKALPIQDNSFLVEEAYNQGRGIVQHVSTFSRANGSGGWDYTFTQEWPVRSQRHQLSYTVPLSRVDGATRETGLGDIALHYRYQAGRMEGVPTAFAPRLSLLLPTGASHRSLGTGSAGVQVNLPLSVELPASLVAHSNIGATVIPRAADALGNRANVRSLSLGQSVIWLVHPKVNLMLEGAWTRTEAGSDPSARTTEFLLSPGIRGAIDFASGLQVVPGVAFPIGVGASRGERSIFLYLSLEHPFKTYGARP